VNSANANVRRHARERALQFLFGLDFTGRPWNADIAYFWEHNSTRESSQAYAERLIAGVCEHQEELDGQIIKALDRWNPDRVGRIEKVVLRIGLYEMLYAADVPTVVAIDEAIELAKMFGAEEAPRFINGVLDRLRKRLSQAKPEEESS
jgi:N utilization substance protein B